MNARWFPLLLPLLLLPRWAEAEAPPGVPILLYHRFGSVAADSMTVTTAVLDLHLQLLQEGGYRVIPLRQLVDYLRGVGPQPPPRSVVITVDDGHRSVFSELYPRLLARRLPVTLFIYPSAISNADYALSWEQLRQLQASGLCDIQSHTYWHPNFRQERQRMRPPAFAAAVELQLRKSKATLEARLGGEVTLLAWPFGIQDQELRAQAAAAGYQAAFTIEPRPARPGEDLLALPRYLLRDADRGAALRGILAAAARSTGGP
jgi:peptidoglycan/xylan/chitin deacetylase (PgdA/CDA1 family)